MNRQRITGLTLVTVLAACGTTRLSNEVQAFVGKDLSELVRHLGRPNGKLESSGDPTYVWLSDSDGVLPGSPTSSATGEGGGGSYLGSRTGAALMPVEYQCRLEVATDAHDVIQRYEVEGSAIGCKQLRKRLNR